MSEPQPIDLKVCPHCLREQVEETMITGAAIKRQTVFLLVFSYRCPLCAHIWSEAHEPVRRVSQ